MRAVAAHFGISVTTVSRYYDTLKAEGLLSSTWGSETVARCGEFNEDRRIRGIVALPARLDCLAAIAHERTLTAAIHDRLWARGFAVRMMFHEQLAPTGRRFADSLLAHKIDAVLWVRPPASASTTAAILDLHRIPVFAIDGAFDNISGRHYTVDRTAAMMSILIKWRNDAVSTFTVATEDDSPANRTVFDLCECAEELQMRCKLALFAATTPELFVDSLSRARGGVVFPSARFALSLAVAAPQQFERLIQTRRVMLPEGPFDFGSPVDIAALTDLLHVRWDSLAARVVDDLVKRSSPTAGESIVHATPSPAWTQKAA